MNVKRRKQSVTFLCFTQERQELKYNLQEIGIGQYTNVNILEYGNSEQGKKHLFLFI